MKFSQYAGTAIVPTLSRLVLALAFVTVGYNKLTTDATFNAADATTLRDLGVTVLPVAGVVTVDAASREIVPIAFRQNEAAAPPGPAAQPDPGADSPQEQPPGESTEATPGQTPLAAGEYTAKSLHRITLLCHKQGWPSPVILAWMAAITEFAGGALLLVGFLSRIWGLGLAITMGVAFYMVSYKINEVVIVTPFKFEPFEFAKNIPDFNTLFSQLGLGLLALGVFLTGPGPISLDRMLFGRRGEASAKKSADAKAGN